MRSVRKMFFRLAALSAPVMAALAMTCAPTQAAGATIVVDDSAAATDCGKYTGQIADTLLQDAVNTAVTNSTIVICPGSYSLPGPLAVSGVKLTIKRALIGAHTRPVIDIADTQMVGLNAANSNLTIEGLIFDGRGNPNTYTGINLIHSSASIKNSTFLGPTQIDSTGISSDDFGQPDAQKLSLVNSNILGYGRYGVFVQGVVKVSVTDSFFDGTDGGRVTSVSSGQSGIFFNGGPTLGETPSGTVSKSRFANSADGVYIAEVGRVSVSDSLFVNNVIGVHITAGDLVNNADGNKITGNTMMGVLSSGSGILVEDLNAPTTTIRGTSITNNVISAVQYELGGLSPSGIAVISNANTGSVTATLSGNTVIGFPLGNGVVISNAAVIDKDTDATP